MGWFSAIWLVSDLMKTANGKKYSEHLLTIWTSEHHSIFGMDKVYYCESIHFFWLRSATFCGKKTTTRSLLSEPVYVASDIFLGQVGVDSWWTFLRLDTEQMCFLTHWLLDSVSFFLFYGHWSSFTFAYEVISGGIVEGLFESYAVKKTKQRKWTDVVAPRCKGNLFAI